MIFPSMQSQQAFYRAPIRKLDVSHNDPGYLQAPAMLALKGFRHAFFTRQGGTSRGLYSSLNGGLGSKDHPDHVAENRKRMAEIMGVRPDLMLSLYQVHSPHVITLTDLHAVWTLEDRPQADAMVTNLKGIALAVASADCGPVLFADPHANVIGAAHAGSKGALGGVLEATLEAMEALGAQRTRITVALGPTISRNAYEVGEDFMAPFLAADPFNRDFFAERGPRQTLHFDLPSFIRHRLNDAGVTRVVDLGKCTYSDDTRFYSYRRSVHRHEVDYGRLISAIAIEAPIKPLPELPQRLQVSPWRF